MKKNLNINLQELKTELLFYYNKPLPLKCFVIKDPKTRLIHKSDFRDRVIHHALCNIIESLFEKTFIYDSYANRIVKGTLKAIERLDYFKRKVSKNNTKTCYVLKADIKHYFENVDHNTLIKILKTKIIDHNILWLIKIILNNYSTDKGMPLGNLTSQFFANVYLNELDQYIKHTLKVKYYIRYVDDFVILSSSKEELIILKEKINDFLQKQLKLTLHPDKSKITNINRGITFLGYRIFKYHKLLKKSNLQKFKIKLNNQIELFQNNLLDFDQIYNFYTGWQGYAKQANTYKFRKRISKHLEPYFQNEVTTSQIHASIVYSK